MWWGGGHAELRKQAPDPRLVDVPGWDCRSGSGIVKDTTFFPPHFPTTWTPPIDPAPILANEIASWDYSKHLPARSAPISDEANVRAIQCRASVLTKSLSKTQSNSVNP